MSGKTGGLRIAEMSLDWLVVDVGALCFQFACNLTLLANQLQNR
jgi:hypothetical protein